jgi:hypothetical protein
MAGEPQQTNTEVVGALEPRRVDNSKDYICAM